jgi:hypothetical protein
MNTEQTAVAAQHAHKGEQHVEVQVVTTSGTFPKEGTHRAPADQPLKIVLKQAQKELEIADTEGWIVTVGGTEIDPNKSYAENGLRGTVKIDWGPKEGGGGKGRRTHA